MTETLTILNKIAACINEDLGLTAICRAIKAYDSTTLPIPIKMTCFSVSAEENKVTYFENELLECCEKNTVKIRVNCYSPLRRTPYMTHGLAEIVMDYLCDEFLPNLKDCTIGNTEYDSDVKAFKITCILTLEYEKCAAQGSSNTGITVPANFFCKSHLNDANIHVSEADRVYLNEPFVIGSYTGSGADYKDISLDFKPKAVIVYRDSYHPAVTTDSASKCYFAIAAGSSYTRGILITAEGFRVRTVATTNATTYLNDSGASYTYIAFR